MRKTTLALMMATFMAGCGSHDPILPGDRTAIFKSESITILNEKIENLPDAAMSGDVGACPYTQDAQNIIWDGDKKVFTGFPTSNCVGATRRPVCHGPHIYAGLTTGEVVKLNPKTRQVAWVADVYRPSNMTGGASVLDIVAPIVVDGASVYAGGLGDAFCRLRGDSGTSRWCVPIATAHPFVIAGPAAFVMSTDGNLYAVRTRDGAVYWRTGVKRGGAPTYAAGKIRIDAQCFNATDGGAISCD